MASYQARSYMPGFTSNDTYGNFYDRDKVSLITVPDRLKNYDLDVRKSQNTTSGSEYGEFLRTTDKRHDNDWYLVPDHKQALSRGLPHDQYVSADDSNEQERKRETVEYQSATEKQMNLWPENVNSQGYGYDKNLNAHATPRHYDDLSLPVNVPSGTQEQASTRKPPPPVYQSTYRQPPPKEISPRRHRSHSPPPPLDPYTYRDHMQLYSGKIPQSKPAVAINDNTYSPRNESLAAVSQRQHDELDAAHPILFGNKEIRLPEVDAVELHMKDRSKVLLNVKEFYSRYLRD